MRGITNNTNLGGSGGGSRVIYLGTGTSFDLSQILPDDYQNLTADNFIIGCTSAGSKQANYSSSAKYTAASGGFVGFTLNKSYNASTGILTISGNSYYGWVWISNSTGSPPGDRHTDGTVTPFAYAVIGEIET